MVMGCSWTRQRVWSYSETFFLLSMLPFWANNCFLVGLSTTFFSKVIWGLAKTGLDSP